MSVISDLDHVPPVDARSRIAKHHTFNSNRTEDIDGDLNGTVL